MRPIAIGDIVILHDESRPRGLWKLGKVQKLLTGVDGNARGAFVKVHSDEKSATILKRPVQRLYPLEIRTTEDVTPLGGEESSVSPAEHSSTDTVTESPPSNYSRPRRQAFLRAQENVKTWMDELTTP